MGIKRGIKRLLALSLLSATCSFAAVEGEFWHEASSDQILSLVWEQYDVIREEIEESRDTYSDEEEYNTFSMIATPADRDELEINRGKYFDAITKTNNEEEQKKIYRKFSDYLDKFYVTIAEKSFGANYGSVESIEGTDQKEQIISALLGSLHDLLKRGIEARMQKRKTDISMLSQIHDKINLRADQRVVKRKAATEASCDVAPLFVEGMVFDIYYERQYEVAVRLANYYNKQHPSRMEFYNETVRPDIIARLKDSAHKAAMLGAKKWTVTGNL